VATNGDNKLFLDDFLKINALLRFILNNPVYRKAWGGILKWVFWSGLNKSSSVKDVLVAAYFRLLFRHC
jgi:hypothetical protein